jgi:hypothetical protein
MAFDDRACAGVVDVAEPLDRRKAKLGTVPIRDRHPRGEHLDQRSAAEDRVRSVEQRRGRTAGRQRDVDR